MRLDRHSSVPLYFQLKEYIIGKIESGEFSHGGKIPSELELCDSLELSRPTVRQAVAELVAEGKLQIIKGKGTFVSSLNASKEIKDFSAMTFSFFNSKEVDKSELIDFGIIQDIPGEVKEAFSDRSIIRDGIVVIRKILSENCSPYAYIESFIPAVLYPNLPSDIKAGKTMVDMTANKYAYLPSKGQCRIGLAPADSSASRALDIARGTPVLTAESVLVSRSGAVCEIVNAYLRSDVCRLTL